MYNLIFTSSISDKTKKRILNLFENNFNLISREIFLSSEPVEILFHFSNNDVLDGEANMLQRFLIIHLSKDFSDDEFLLLLAHELFHLSHYDFFGESSGNLETIIDEGLAIFLEERMCKKLKLKATAQNKTWKKPMLENEIKEMIKKAVSNDDIFNSKWRVLYNNINLEDETVADRVIYQCGYWLVNEISKRLNCGFEELFFENKEFWLAQTKVILGL